MNLISVFLFNLLLATTCLTVNANRESTSNEVQQRNETEDFLYPVFDLAELEDILHLAKNPQISLFVRKHIFPVKYHNYRFNLQIGPDPEVHMFPNSLYIPDLNLFVDVINHFGESITNIGIIWRDDINENDSAVLYQSINDHCSESLITFDMGTIKEYTFANFTKPFTKMNKLYLEIKTDEIGSNIPLAEIFPNLEYMRIDYYDDFVYNNQNDRNRFIECELPAMPNLKHFDIYMEVRLNRSDVDTIQNQIGNMLQKNPQIEKLWYSEDLNDFIQQINEYLPNLEDFSISNLDPEIRPVHFENVKFFMVSAWGGTTPIDRISFSRLDTLHMYYSLNNGGKSMIESWKAFFRNHQNLRQLNCDAIEEEGLVEFLAELPKAEEIRIHSFRLFDIELVSRLIESSNNWLKFHYDANPTLNGIDPDMTDFCEKFEHEWRIFYSFEGRPFIDLERKN